MQRRSRLLRKFLIHYFVFGHESTELASWNEGADTTVLEHVLARRKVVVTSSAVLVAIQVDCNSGGPHHRGFRLHNEPACGKTNKQTKKPKACNNDYSSLPTMRDTALQPCALYPPQLDDDVKTVCGAAIAKYQFSSDISAGESCPDEFWHSCHEKLLKSS